ncbi:hypothetical protein Hanom_Chr11g00998031 [Helianthus anomalus]
MSKDCTQGRFLEGPWQGHDPGKFFRRSANFPHFDRNFLYILCLARAFFSARVFRPWHVQRARSATDCTQPKSEGSVTTTKEPWNVEAQGAQLKEVSTLTVTTELITNKLDDG